MKKVLACAGVMPVKDIGLSQH